MELFIRKLNALFPLDDDARAALQSLKYRTRRFRAGEILLSAGNRPFAVTVVCDGWASRCSDLKDGKRLITGLVLRGDVCNVDISGEDCLDYSVEALTDGQALELPLAALQELTAHHPAVAHGFRRIERQQEAVLRAWLVNLGLRQTLERTAHLFCEINKRLSDSGLIGLAELDVPLTQRHLAEALGTSEVHINRVLQRLQKANLITLERQHVVIHDLDRLAALSGFDGDYLHARAEAGRPGRVFRSQGW